MTYKEFIKASKHVVNFAKFNFLRRLIFYIEAPLRYKKFKKVLKYTIENERGNENDK